MQQAQVQQAQAFVDPSILSAMPAGALPGKQPDQMPGRNFVDPCIVAAQPIGIGMFIPLVCCWFISGGRNISCCHVELLVTHSPFSYSFRWTGTTTDAAAAAAAVLATPAATASTTAADATAAGATVSHAGYGRWSRSSGQRASYVAESNAKATSSTAGSTAPKYRCTQFSWYASWQHATTPSATETAPTAVT